MSVDDSNVHGHQLNQMDKMVKETPLQNVSLLSTPKYEFIIWQ